MAGEANIISKISIARVKSIVASVMGGLPDAPNDGLTYARKNKSWFSLFGEFNSKTDKIITTNRQTASYILVASDADKLVEMNVGSANNLTVPANIFTVGQQLLIAQYGGGQTTIQAGAGMTIRSSGGKTKLSAQYSGATIIFLSATEAYLFGDITT